MVSLVGLSTVMVSTSFSSARVEATFLAAIVRSMLNFTASASSGVPSENSMPGLSSTTIVCGSVAVADLARPGE